MPDPSWPNGGHSGTLFLYTVTALGKQGQCILEWAI